MNSTESIKYKRFGFDNNSYLQTQKKAILDRVDKFRGGRLYIEIGGKFLFDPHAARVLPGYDPENKVRLLEELKSVAEIVFCVSAVGIIENRQLKNQKESYSETILKMATEIKEKIATPIIVINLTPREVPDEVKDVSQKFKEAGFTVYLRYQIENYSANVENTLSSEGFGNDDYIESNKQLFIVTGAGSNSGKMSTCLGQIYLDYKNNLNSGYAKFETFPIWSLPLDHPVNLAYEAATADIGDYNMVDPYHLDAYGQRSINYNRDVDAFRILKGLTRSFLPESSPLNDYQSPTDMGINHAGSAIRDDEVVCVASLREILRRKDWYQQISERGDGNISWLEKCSKLYIKAFNYMKLRGYSADLSIADPGSEGVSPSEPSIN